VGVAIFLGGSRFQYFRSRSPQLRNQIVNGVYRVSRVGPHVGEVFKVII
jgi:hypothetical protein